MKRNIESKICVRKLPAPWINPNLTILNCYKLACCRPVMAPTVIRARKHRGSRRRPHHSVPRKAQKLSIQPYHRLSQLAARRKKPSSSAAIRIPQRNRPKALSIAPPKRYPKRKAPAKRTNRRRKRIFYAYEHRPAKQTTADPEVLFRHIDPPAEAAVIETVRLPQEEPVAQAPSTAMAMDTPPAIELHTPVDDSLPKLADTDPHPVQTDADPLEEMDPPQPKQSARMEDHVQASKMEPIMTQACVSYRNEDQAASFTEVSLLDAIWDIGWEQFIQVQWEHDWKDVRYEAKLMIEDTRIDEAESTFVWLTGQVRLTAIGTTLDSPDLRHQMTFIPFSSTVLRPFSEKRPLDPKSCDILPPYQPSIRAETGDWHVKAVLERDQADGQMARGMIHVSGRVWWFRKQLIPLSIG